MTYVRTATWACTETVYFGEKGRFIESHSLCTPFTRAYERSFRCNLKTSAVLADSLQKVSDGKGGRLVFFSETNKRFRIG